MQPNQRLPATNPQPDLGKLRRNPPATPPQPLLQLALTPCPHCCGEGYLISQGAGHFDLHDECWMPNEDIDPCPTCHGTGRQPINWDDPNLEDTLPQPQRNPTPGIDNDLPRLPF